MKMIPVDPGEVDSATYVCNVYTSSRTSAYKSELSIVSSQAKTFPNSE